MFFGGRSHRASLEEGDASFVLDFVLPTRMLCPSQSSLCCLSLDDGTRIIFCWLSITLGHLDLSRFNTRLLGWWILAIVQKRQEDRFAERKGDISSAFIVLTKERNEGEWGSPESAFTALPFRGRLPVLERPACPSRES